MTRRLAPFAAICALWLLVPALGCTERPEDGLDDLLAAVHEQDADRAWSRFDQASQKMMEHTAALLRESDVPGSEVLAGEAKRHLIEGFAPRGTERIELVSRDGDRAVVRVVDFEGKTQPVQMRYERDRWRVHLDGASPGE